jgi:iron complex outermembrane receptor protein
VTAAHTDGFWRNLFDGKTYGGRDTMAGRLSAKWDISPNATWILRVDGAIMNGDGLNPAPIDTATASAAQLAHLSAVLGAFGGTPAVYSYPPRFTVNQRFVHPRLRDSQYGVTSDVSWDVSPDFTVRLIDTYRSCDDAQTDGDVVFTTLDMANQSESPASNVGRHILVRCELG